MIKRKAETLIEVVVAMMIFGVLMSGISEFMAEQLKNVARVTDKDEMIYFAQHFQQTGDKNNDRNVEIKSKDLVVTVTKGAETLTFNLNPSN